MPDGKIMHCQMQYGPMSFFIADEFPNMSQCKSPRTLGGTCVTIHLNSPDVDSAFERAVAAGATVLMPVKDMFWGDRYGMLSDPFGHHWSIATHKQSLTPDQMHQRAAEWTAHRKESGRNR